jgi:hypothetical protein
LLLAALEPQEGTVNRTLLYVAAVVGLSACDDPLQPNQSVASSAAAGPTQSISNGPSTLPNVFRFEGMVGGAAFVDPRTDLVAFDGLPENPADLVECGGSEEILNLAEFQISGLLSEVFHLLARAEENIHVYQLSTFVDLCTSVPLAQGRGRLTINDNDAAVSGTRTNSFGARLVGPVALARGGSAHLSAHTRFLIKEDGTFVVASQAVHMSQ